MCARVSCACAVLRHAPEEAAGVIKGRPAGTTNLFFPSVMAGPPCFTLGRVSAKLSSALCTAAFNSYFVCVVRLARQLSDCPGVELVMMQRNEITV